MVLRDAARELMVSILARAEARALRFARKFPFWRNKRTSFREPTWSS
jgi:hypothetical protein